jgi:hypothetical protein
MRLTSFPIKSHGAQPFALMVTLVAAAAMLSSTSLVALLSQLHQ